MDDPRMELVPPDEPEELRAETRALVEDSPEEGNRLVKDGRFLADPLWEKWGAELEDAGMSYERFLGITRGYEAEVRLWVIGERPWDHCVAGLRGRLLRRLPRRCREREPALAEVNG